MTLYEATYKYVYIAMNLMVLQLTVFLLAAPLVIWIEMLIWRKQ